MENIDKQYTDHNPILNTINDSIYKALFRLISKHHSILDMHIYLININHMSNSIKTLSLL